MSTLKKSSINRTELKVLKRLAINHLMTSFVNILIISLLTFGLVSPLFSQVHVSGQVKGIPSRDSRISAVLLKDAVISCATEGESKSVVTNLLGMYEITLKENKRYLFTVSRENYNSKSIWISTSNLPKTSEGSKIDLSNLNFNLYKRIEFPDDISQKEDMGQLTFNHGQKSFVLSENKDFAIDRIKTDNSLKLIDKAITIVADKPIAQNERSQEPQPDPDVQLNETSEDRSDDKNKSEKLVEELITTIDLSQMDSEEEISKQRIALDSARRDLELLKKQIKTKEDSLYVGKLEAQLKSLEVALNSAEKTIEHQKTIIAYQKRLITIYILSAILLLAIILVGIWFYREKVRLNHMLEEKNQLILDGITYANTIQNSFLKSIEDIRKFLPDFVLFFKPRDIVSGDIYWVGQVDDKVIVAAIDCTGHGVPGAFISMIANTLLNEIVNNKKQFDPGSILNELHLGVMEVLQQDAGGSQSQDGMDMSLVVINKNKKEMRFAGARNHMVKIKAGEVETIKADINSIGGRSLRSSDGFKKSFTTKEISLDVESTYFLYSDGFIDQFGGNENQKFNLPKFYELLKVCSLKSPLDQEKELASSFEDWKGKNEQLDDVLVLGFKI